MSNESTAYILSIDETPREIFLQKLPSFEQFLEVLNNELGLGHTFTPCRICERNCSSLNHES